MLYFLILSFLITLGISISLKLDFDTAYLQGKNETIEMYTDQINFYNKFISAKAIYGLGSTIFAAFFGVPDAKDAFVPMINSFPTYFYHDGMEIYS
jgi:hypothetical protein